MCALRVVLRIVSHLKVVNEGCFCSSWEEGSMAKGGDVKTDHIIGLSI